MKKADRLNMHELRIRRTKLNIEMAHLRSQRADKELEIAKVNSAIALVAADCADLDRQIGEAQLAEHERNHANETKHGKDLQHGR